MSAWAADESDSIDAFLDVVKAIVEEAVPSSTPGSTAPLGALNTLISEGKITVEAVSAAASSVVQSGAENVGCVVAFIVDCIELHKEMASTDRDVGAIKTKAADMMDHLAKLGTGSLAIAETVATLIQKTGGAEAPAALSASAASYGGAAVGYANALRTGRKGAHSERRFLRLVNLKQEVVTKAKSANADLKQHELLLLLDYAIAKLRRRSVKQWSSVFAGVLGSTSTIILATLAATAVVNAWNPVGWTLFVAGAAAGLALVSYASIRHFTKKHRRKHRAKKGHPGNVEEFANRLLVIFENNSGKHVDWQAYAFRMLQIFHVNVTDSFSGHDGEYRLYNKAASKQKGEVIWNFAEPAKAAARKRIRRHLKG